MKSPRKVEHLPAYQHMCSSREEIRDRSRKNILKNNGRKLPKFLRNNKLKQVLYKFSIKKNADLQVQHSKDAGCQRQGEILKAREKQLVTVGKPLLPIILTPDFLPETVKTRKQWYNIFKMLKEKNCQPRVLHTLSKRK